MLYSYDANVSSVCWLTERTLYHHASHLLSDLSEARKECKDRPLIFVAHSLGGLLVKSALIFSRNADTPSSTDNSSPTDIRTIYDATIGIVSFGTPQTFAGNEPISDLISGLCRLPEYLWSNCSARKPRYDDIDDICSDESEWIQDLKSFRRRLDEYKTIAERIPEVFCFESSRVENKMAVPPKLGFVNKHCKAVSIKRNHLELAKCAAFDHHDYKTISDSILKFYNCRLERKNSDISEVAVSTPVSVRDLGFTVKPHLPQRPPKFVSGGSEHTRDDYLDKLGNRLSTDRIAIITGQPGYGKTTLALQYAYRQLDLDRKDPKKPTSIFWISAESKLSLEVSFLYIAYQLDKHYDGQWPDETGHDKVIHAMRNVRLDKNGLPKRDEDRDFTIHAVIDWLSYPENKKWLLIYDDVDDEEAPYFKKFLPRAFHPPNKPTRGQIVLITRSANKISPEPSKNHIELDRPRQDSRGQNDTQGPDRPFNDANAGHAKVTKTGISRNFVKRSSASFFGLNPPNSGPPKALIRSLTQPIEVNKFNREESKALIETLSKSRSESGPEREQAINNIANQLSDVPLDLYYAGTYLSSTDVPEVAQNELSNVVFEEFPAEHAEWFNTCAMLGRDSIPMCLQFQPPIKQDELFLWVKYLQARGWTFLDQISESVESPWDRPRSLESFRIPSDRQRQRRQYLGGHVLDHEYASKACNAVAATVKYLRITKDENQITRSGYEQLLIRHVDECLTHLVKYGSLIKCDWDILADLCERHGLFVESADFYRVAKDQEFDDENTTRQSSSRQLSIRQSSERLTVDNDGVSDAQSSKSAKMWNNPQEDVQAEQSHLTNKTNETKGSRKLQSELGLIRVQLQLSQFHELDTRCQDVIRQVKERRERRYFDLWTGALELLVKIKVAQGKWYEAIATSRTLIDTLEEKFGPTAAETVRALDQLAQMHFHQGDYEGAEPLLKQVRRIYEGNLGETHPRTVAIDDILARTYKEQGDIERACDLYLQVLEARTRQLGEDHIETARVKENLASVYDMMESYKPADMMYKSAIYAAEIFGGNEENNVELRRMKEGWETLRQARKLRKPS
ncbi:uncharacterized protein BDZ99DRAFT_45061 [Mytilinidion resinicola]|uniref:TPR-like protein n=1 Tax=Mytilinidion resinicola TaxID=574789 RepID=A0A6A6YMI3_9PEZI|nr:uncharacterized protein BDZ99DRAFT_45061 [Mytilinidion resinicola]KAF2809077.1 hypothetical protein BDZ99DRAFT_45061 [Mytilinidion resinicola]